MQKRFPNYFYGLDCSEQYSLLVQTLLSKYSDIVLDQELFDGIIKDYYELMNIYNDECFFGCLPMQDIEIVPKVLNFGSEYIKYYINNFIFHINVKGDKKSEDEFISYLESIKEISDIKKKVSNIFGIIN
jgi:hypothetical protein